MTNVTELSVRDRALASVSATCVIGIDLGNGGGVAVLSLPEFMGVWQTSAMVFSKLRELDPAMSEEEALRRAGIRKVE